MKVNKTREQVVFRLALRLSAKYSLDCGSLTCALLAMSVAFSQSSWPTLKQNSFRRKSQESDGLSGGNS